MFNDLQEATEEKIIISVNSPFLFGIKSQIVQSQVLEHTEKEAILRNIPDNKKTIDKIAFIKALGYSTYIKQPQVISQDKMEGISPETLLSFIYLNHLSVNMGLVYNEYDFNAPLEQVVPVSRILLDRGLSLEDAIRFHPELLSMNQAEIYEYLNAQENLDVLTKEEEKSLDMLEKRESSEISYLGHELRDLLFHALLTTHQILIPERNLQKTRERIVTQLLRYNEPLVKNLVRLRIEKARRGDFADELHTAGMNGLSKAITRYDIRKGFKFSTYATFWIRREMDICYGNDLQSYRLPAKKQNLVKLYNRIEGELMQKLKTETVPLEEILEGMRLKVPKLCKEDDLLDAVQQNRVWEKQYEDEYTDLHIEAPEAVVSKKQRRLQFLLGAKSFLSDEEMDLLLSRYPLFEDIPRLTQGEVAKRLGVTRQAVGLRENTILKKLAKNPKLLGLLQ